MKKIALFTVVASTLLTGCRHTPPSDGWYHTENGRTVTGEPIVTPWDFGSIRIDSTMSGESMQYGIVVKLKAEAAGKFAGATEANIGKMLGFLCDGKVIASPQVNQRIDGGLFGITTFHNDREKTMAVFDRLKAQMDPAAEPSGDDPASEETEAGL